MSEAKHTAGPWKAVKGIVESDSLRCGVTAVRGNIEYLVATIENGVPGDFCETEEANARLIAAAPELLEQLARLYRAYVNLMEAGRNRIISLGGDCDPVDRMEAGDPALIAARTVLSKAGGRS